MSFQVTISGILMERAREAYNQCIRDRVLGKVLTTTDNNFSYHALTVYIMVATALEAFINEVCLSPISATVNKVDIPVEMVENIAIRDKYYLLPLLFWGKTFDCGVPPYQDFEMLIRLRNSLMHYKMTISTGDVTPKYHQYLKNKNLLMTSGEPGVGLLGGLLDELCSSKAALWAYNTACMMANALVDLSDDKTKGVWQSVTLSNFREIPEQYWKTLVPDGR